LLKYKEIFSKIPDESNGADNPRPFFAQSDFTVGFVAIIPNFCGAVYNYKKLAILRKTALYNKNF